MATTHLQLVSVPVSDQDGSRDFYAEVLGFETIADERLGPDTRWLQMRPPGGVVSISLVTWFESMPAGSLRGLVIASDDLDADFVRLQSHGVAVDGGIQDQPWGRFVTFEDPDGNGLILESIRVVAPG